MIKFWCWKIRYFFKTSLSLAMSFPPSKMSALSFGLQSSIVQRKVDNTQFIYPDQFNGTGYDPNLASGRVVLSAKEYFTLILRRLIVDLCT